MENQYELKYEKTIIEMILSNNNPNLNKTDLFMDFHRNSSIYYDNFCSALYALSSGESTQPLWISVSGDAYLAFSPRNRQDRHVLSFDQIPEFIDDLHAQLSVALETLANFH